MWTVIDKGNQVARKLADAHYTRHKPGSVQWCRPGYNYCLLYADECGAAVFVWWRPKWEAGINRMDGLRALECTIFRNCSGARSSDLIAAAIDALGWHEARRELHMSDPLALPLITGVSSEKTKARRSKHAAPGKCFRVAGFVDFDHAKGTADVWLRYEPICVGKSLTCVHDT